MSHSFIKATIAGIQAPSLGISLAAAALGTLAVASLAVLIGNAGGYGPVGTSLGLLASYCLAVIATARVSTSRRLPHGLAVAVVFGLAISLRLACFLWLFEGNPPRGGDPHIYRQMAADLLETGRLVVYDSGFNQHLKAFYPPMYVWVLAAVTFLFGAAQSVVFGLNLLIDLGLIGVVYWLGRRLAGERAGLVAALLLAAWPAMILSCGYAQKDSLAALICLLVVSRLVAATRAELDTWKVAIPCGIGWGVVALTQPSLALLPPLMGILFGFGCAWRTVLRLGVRAALVFVTVMTPWWVRNYVELGAFVPLTTASGWTLWVGNNPLATGRWMAPPVEFRNLPELEVSRVAAATARDWIVANFDKFIKVSFAKAVHALGGDTFPLVRVRIDAPGKHHVLGAAGVVLQGYYVVLLSCAALASWRCRLRLACLPQARLAAVVLLVVAVQLVAFNVWFEFHERHRYVLHAFISLFAGTAVASSMQSSRPGRHGEMGQVPLGLSSAA